MDTLGNSALFRLVSFSDPCKYLSPQSHDSSRASFDFGHGFDLHCVLYGRLGSGVPGYTRIFLGGRWGIWDECFTFRAVFVEFNWAVKKEKQLLSSKGRGFSTLNSSKKNYNRGKWCSKSHFLSAESLLFFSCHMFDSCYKVGGSLLVIFMELHSGKLT